MFGAARYFTGRYWAGRYWPKAGSGAALTGQTISLDLYFLQRRSISMSIVRSVLNSATVSRTITRIAQVTRSRIRDLYISKKRGIDLERQ